MLVERRGRPGTLPSAGRIGANPDPREVWTGNFLRRRRTGDWGATIKTAEPRLRDPNHGIR